MVKQEGRSDPQFEDFFTTPPVAPVFKTEAVEAVEAVGDDTPAPTEAATPPADEETETDEDAAKAKKRAEASAKIKQLLSKGAPKPAMLEVEGTVDNPINLKEMSANKAFIAWLNNASLEELNRVFADFKVRYPQYHSFNPKPIAEKVFANRGKLDNLAQFRALRKGDDEINIGENTPTVLQRFLKILIKGKHVQIEYGAEAADKAPADEPVVAEEKSATPPVVEPETVEPEVTEEPAAETTPPPEAITTWDDFLALASSEDFAKLFFLGYLKKTSRKVGKLLAQYNTGKVPIYDFKQALLSELFSSLALRGKITDLKPENQELFNQFFAKISGFPITEEGQSEEPVKEKKKKTKKWEFPWSRGRKKKKDELDQEGVDNLLAEQELVVVEDEPALVEEPVVEPEVVYAEEEIETEEEPVVVEIQKDPLAKVKKEIGILFKKKQYAELQELFLKEMGKASSDPATYNQLSEMFKAVSDVIKEQKGKE